MQWWRNRRMDELEESRSARKALSRLVVVALVILGLLLGHRVEAASSSGHGWWFGDLSQPLTFVSKGTVSPTTSRASRVSGSSAGGRGGRQHLTRGWATLCRSCSATSRRGRSRRTTATVSVSRSGATLSTSKPSSAPAEPNSRTVAAQTRAPKRRLNQIAHLLRITAGQASGPYRVGRTGVGRTVSGPYSEWAVQ